jgi:hypothetical protein
MVRSVVTRLAAVLTLSTMAIGGVLMEAAPASAATTRDEIVAVATAQLGGHGCNPGYYGSCGIEWCAEFARWVWAHAGVSDVAGLDSYAQSFKTYGQNRGTYHTRASGYTPQPGDAIVFDWDHSSTDAHPIDHVAIVTSVSASTVYTIGGNQGNSDNLLSSVSRSSYARSNGDIDGYVEPVGVQSGSSASRPPLPDFSGDGVADLVGVSADGHMQYYPNNSGSNANHVPFATSGLAVGDGWNAYTALYTGDFSGDSVDDLIAVTADGHMQYYPNNSGSNANHVPFAGSGVADGAGWNAYTKLYAADFSGDGAADLIAVTADGHLQYYPNNSGSNANHVPFAGIGLADGDGWNAYTNFYAADFSGDGVADLIAVTADGHMQYYPNNSGSNANHVPFAGSGLAVGDGWNAYTKLYAADFSGDDVADLIAVTADGHMQYYPNNSGSNANHVPFVGAGLADGAGWNAYAALYAADFSGDGTADLIGVTADGHLQYYPNNSGSNANHVPFAGSGLADGEGWNAYTNLYT